MVNFLVFTCIKPQKRKFLGIVPLKSTPLLAAILILLCTLYTSNEAQTFYEYEYFLLIIGYETIYSAQLIIALLTAVCFLLSTSRIYTKLMYEVTFGLAGFCLAINFWKKSIFMDEYEDYEILEWLYLIRIGVECAIELYSCYMIFSVWQAIQ